MGFPVQDLKEVSGNESNRVLHKTGIKLGFTYDPNQFMAADIFYYNFAWRDYGEASTMGGLLDMVKVLSFALSEGKVR